MSDKDEVLGDDRRVFEYTVGSELKEYYLGLPTSEQIRRAEWHYSKVYNKALVEGVSTSSEMMDILTQRGIYGPEYEKKLHELQVDIAIKIAQMQNEKDEDKQSALAREVHSLRDELYRWNQRLTGPLSNTCEQMAEDAKTEYLTSVVVQDEAGKLIWESYDAFVAEENQGLALKARFEVMLWLQGLESDFLDKTPEQKVLQDIARHREEARRAEEALKLEAPVEEEQPKKTRAKRKPSTKKANAKAAAE